MSSNFFFIRFALVSEPDRMVFLLKARPQIPARLAACGFSVSCPDIPGEQAWSASRVPSLALTLMPRLGKKTSLLAFLCIFSQSFEFFF